MPRLVPEECAAAECSAVRGVNGHVGVEFSIASLLGRRGCARKGQSSGALHWACCEQHRQLVLANIARNLFPPGSKEASYVCDDEPDLTFSRPSWADLANDPPRRSGRSRRSPLSDSRGTVLLALQRALDNHDGSAESQSDELRRIMGALSRRQHASYDE